MYVDNRRSGGRETGPTRRRGGGRENQGCASRAWPCDLRRSKDFNEGGVVGSPAVNVSLDYADSLDIANVRNRASAEWAQGWISVSVLYERR